MLRTIHDPDRGAGVVEYAVVIVLAAAILAGLVVAGVPGRLQDGTRESVAVLLGEKPAKAPGRSADGGDSSPDDIVSISAPGAPKKPADDDGVNEEWWDGSGTWGAPSDKMPLFGFQDRGGYNWDCGQVLDGFCKIGGGLYKGARDITDPIADIACLAHICSHSGFKNNWGSTADGVKKVFTQSPWTTAKEMWGGFKEPFDESAKNGGGFKNTAYAIPSAIGSVLSFKGVTKAFKKEKKAKEKEEKKKDEKKKPEKPKKESNGHEPGQGMGDADVPPADHADALAWGKKRIPPPKNLKRVESESLLYYSGGAPWGGSSNVGFQHINRMLRGDAPLRQRTPQDEANAKKAVKGLDSAMKKNRLRESVISYRTVKSDFLERLGVDPSNPASVEGLTGRSLQEKGYMSTAYSKLMGHSNEPGAVNMRVRIPEGHGAVNIDDPRYSAYGGEAELLVDRDSRYIVHAAYIDKNGQVQMDVEIVPKGWKKPAD